MRDVSEHDGRLVIDEAKQSKAEGGEGKRKGGKTCENRKKGDDWGKGKSNGRI